MRLDSSEAATTIPAQRAETGQPAAARWPGGTRLGAEGRYWVEALIGEGGFGQVYLARDTRLDRLCVVKRLVLSAGWGEATRRLVAASFGREARLLVSLNSPGHPNIPEIYDYVEPQRCLVMKHIAGETLRDLVARRGGRLPQAEALRIAREICAALVYMHGREEPVLHRDVKPANVIIDEAGRPWLIDFGLSKAAPLRVAPGAGPASQLAGTLGFAPPEQWRGEAGPRSDIYGLAATLYALLGGGMPEQSELLRIASGAAALPPLRAVEPAASPALERLLARALAPQPELRPDAAELLEALDALIRLDELPPAPEPARPPAGAALIGREAELAALAAELRLAHLALVCGPPGIGKTSLAAALALAHAPAGRVFWHRFRAGEGAEPLCWGLAGFLTRHGRAELWQMIHGAERAGAAPPTAEQLAGYLPPLLRGRGLLLCLDDLHLVADDRAAVAVIERLVHEAGAGGLDLLVTARQIPGFLPPVAPLAGLQPAAVAAISAARSVELPPELLAQLHTLTGGVPQLLVLALDAARHAADPAALLRRLADAPAVERFLLREVDAALSAEERAVMGAVALLGDEGGSRGAVEAALGRGGLRGALAALVAAYLLSVDASAAEPRYQQHLILQQFYVDSISAEERRGMHARLSEHFASAGPELLQAARHALRAGDAPRAAAHAVRDVRGSINAGRAGALGALLAGLPLAQLPRELAAEVCTARGEAAAFLGSYQEARHGLERALELGAAADAGAAQLEAQARRRRLLAMVAGRVGDYARAEADCRNGLTLALALGGDSLEPARLHAELAEILMRRGELDGSEAACRAGLAALPAGPAALRERVALGQRLAAIAGRRGRYPEAIAGLRRSLALAREIGDQALVAAILNNLGIHLQATGDKAGALSAYAESQALMAHLGDMIGQVSIWINAGVLHQIHGDYQLALSSFAQAQQRCERLDLREPLAWVLTNQGYIELMQGHAAEARTTLGRALELGRSVGEEHAAVDALFRLGDVALALGEPAAARAHAEAALLLARRIGSAAYELCALRVLGEALLAAGEPGVAEALGRAAALQAEVGDPFDGALLLAARARLAAAEGDRQQARSLRDEGLDLARAHSLSYPEAVLRGLPVA